MGSGAGRALRAVIFDYGGVVRREDRADYGAVDEANGLPRGALWAAMHDIPEYRPSRQGAIGRDDYRAAVRRALMHDAGDETRAEAALQALDRYSAAQPPVEPGMRALLARLRAAGRVKLGLLSNAFRGGTERLRAAGVTPLFDDAIISGDVGLAKPDPAVFVLAVTRLGVEPALCLMVDDQPRNVEGALAAGLRAHLHERSRLAELIARLETDGAL
jgi:putative hydrolase of the HAD superfamily